MSLWKAIITNGSTVCKSIQLKRSFEKIWVINDIKTNYQ